MVLVGTWTCDAPRTSWVIQWQNGVVEHITMAADNQSISGVNNYGAQVGGTPLRP